MRSLFLALLLSHSALALAGGTINESRDSASDAKIRFNSIEGDVRVVVGSNNRWQLSGTLSDSVERVVINGDEQAWTIELKYHQNKRSFGSSDLTLSVPAQVKLDLQTVSADVDVDALTGERVEVQTVSGDISSRAQPRRLEIQSVSGDLDLRAGAYQTTQLETVSGDIDARELNGSLDAQSVSGEIRISEAQLNQARLESVSGDLNLTLELSSGASLKASSHSGDVHVRIPELDDLDIQIETFSGDISSAWGKEIKNRRGPGSQLDYSQGSGNTEIKLNSFSGDVHLQRR